MFFARTTFIAYKYAFIALLIPSIIITIQKAIDSTANLKWKKLTIPIAITCLYAIHFKTSPFIIKESCNIAFVILFVIYSSSFKSKIFASNFLKLICMLTCISGIVAIIKKAMTLFSVQIPYQSLLFEGNGFSLVNDNNFYSLHFILLTIISTWLFSQKQIKRLTYLTFNLIAIINIIACTSRRGYVLYCIVFLSVFIYATRTKNNCKKIIICNSLILIGLATIGILSFFFTNLFYKPESSLIKKERYHKLYSLIDKNVTLEEFDIKLQKSYYNRVFKGDDNNNLFFNGNLEYGITNWGCANEPKLNIASTIKIGNENNHNYIRTERLSGDGYFQVIYYGRPILYHKDVTYNLTFKYRSEGNENAQFNIGWWAFENGIWINQLPKNVIHDTCNWYQCSIFYTFTQDQWNPTCFLNGIQHNVPFDIKDIRLTCNDTTGLPMYIDQLPDSIIHQHYATDEGNINHLTHTRTDRWKYAWELWQTKYSTTQKIFGHGFDYLEWYGEKFYNNPKRYDFPHNPIISSFLYSGIIGGIVYIWFLIMSLWLYWKKRKQLGIFFIMYLCCMFFCMFSGSSHFSFPLFAFLSFLPFVEYKDKQETDAVSNTTEQIVND